MSDDQIMDVIYLGEDADRDEFKTAFAKEFPDITIEDDYDDVHQWRSAIHYSPTLRDRIMIWLIREGWASSSIHIQFMIKGGKAEDHEQVRKWIDASGIKDAKKEEG